MSLVAYGSSDESSDEEVNSEEIQQNVINKTSNLALKTSEITVPHSKSHLSLPIPKYTQNSEKIEEHENINGEEEKKFKLEFGALPKPKSSFHSADDIVEDDDIPSKNSTNSYEKIVDDDIPLVKPKPFVAEKIIKPIKAPARISVPSLSDFKDVEEDLEKSKSRRQPSKRGIGLFAILPQPQSEISTKKNNFVPHVLTKTAVNPTPKKSATIVKKVPETIIKEVKNPLTTLDYDSNSEDEDEGNEKIDFFALSKPVTVPEPMVSTGMKFFSIPEDETKSQKQEVSGNINEEIVATNLANYKDYSGVIEPQASDTTLVSTVMNMPREEIILKNKAEVGPKLPVPEQEYNVDAAGNVAIDDKAIEYLHGKRGVKRKNKMIDEVNIMEINGDDIKPDEREWLVKAMTEEPVQRPISMQGGGPSSQSKKKHQITYLAHQAKAMEVELKNTWSQNRMTRKQTQSKYGF